jgi:NAD(P)-dependent dehydrogenase (short-subunit alcohol dehydrogenase family)
VLLKPYCRSGKQDAIVHNAGSLVNKPFADLTQADLESVYKVNVFELRTDLSMYSFY